MTSEASTGECIAADRLGDAKRLSEEGKLSEVNIRLIDEIKDLRTQQEALNRVVSSLVKKIGEDSDDEDDDEGDGEDFSPMTIDFMDDMRLVTDLFDDVAGQQQHLTRNIIPTDDCLLAWYIDMVGGKNMFEMTDKVRRRNNLYN